MTNASVIDKPLGESENLTKLLKKKSSQKNVRSAEERLLIKSTAFAWFNNHRPQIITFVKHDNETLLQLDQQYTSVLEASEHERARSSYLTSLKQIRTNLISLRSNHLSTTPAASVDTPPDFSPLISDIEMQKILIGRWVECTSCISCSAVLAATVMMGGLLETILLARINTEDDKSVVFKAKAAPKDATSGKVKQLKEWTLNDYIQVVHELGWISFSAKDVGAVLREYRNYVHPHKQYTHGVHLTDDDASLFWEVTKNIVRQVIKNVSK